ncbi:MAG: C25 family cysteine peptidase [Acidobacteriota bacterium]
MTRRVFWLVFTVWIGWSAMPSRLHAERLPTLKLTVDEPGVYAVDRAELADRLGVAAATVPERWSVRHGDVPIAAWVDQDDGSWNRLLVAVPSDRFDRRPMRAASPWIALLVEPSTDPMSPWPPLGELASSTPVAHRIVIEENRLRVPLVTKDIVLGHVDTLWFWAIVSQRQSAVLTLDLDPFLDLRPDRIDDFDLQVRLLGWTFPELPPEIPQHTVELTLNGRTIGAGSWNGRRLHTVHVPEVDAALLRDRGNVLTVAVPQRTVSGREGSSTATPIIDLSYVDRVEIRYDTVPRVDTVSASTAPYVASLTPIAGLSVADGRVFPTRPEEAFVVRDGSWKTPHVSIWRDGPPPLPPTDYLAVVPERWLADVEPLLDLHRRRGLRVAAVAVEDLFDHHGDGLRSVDGIRNFLLAEHERHGVLQFVVLVGDTDWLVIDDPPLSGPFDHASSTAADPKHHQVPTGTFLSPYGPAASDHLIAVADENETRPRFAVGRLPVRSRAELADVVSKLLKTYATLVPQPAELAMLSGLDGPSQDRSRRLHQRLLADADQGVAVHRSTLTTDTALDLQAVDVFRREPAVVYFAGHGSRHIWGLGGPHELGETTRFDFDDLHPMPPPSRLPVVLSISCATAPFDHPSSGSLGEAMVLDPERGAVAFVGASATLYTPPAFSIELITRFLWQGHTLGEALVEAKAAVNKPRISHLYNLLGDPALPLTP